MLAVARSDAIALVAVAPQSDSARYSPQAVPGPPMPDAPSPSSSSDASERALLKPLCFLASTSRRLVASLSFERVGFTVLLRWGYVLGFGIYVVFGFCCERHFFYGSATR